MCSFLFFSNFVIVHLSNWVEEYPSFQQSAVNIFVILKELEVNVSRPSLRYHFGGQQVFDESCEYWHFAATGL